MVLGIKPTTLEPWADETMTVDSAYDRIGGDKDDVQGRCLKGAMSYHADLTHERYMKTVLDPGRPAACTCRARPRTGGCAACAIPNALLVRGFMA